LGKFVKTKKGEVAGMAIYSVGYDVLPHRWMYELIDSPDLEEAADLLEAAVPTRRQPAPQESAREFSGHSIWRFISNIVFYMGLAAVVLTAVIFSEKANGGTALFGFRYFEVLSASMQSTIPKGSLVLTQKMPSDTIRVGDVITYLRSDEEFVTHQVIRTVPNFDGRGALGFETKGTDNPESDPDLVGAANVVGVVKAHVRGLGFILRYIKDNIKYVFLGFVLIILFSIAMRVLLDEWRKGGLNNPKRIAAI